MDDVTVRLLPYRVDRGGTGFHYRCEVTWSTPLRRGRSCRTRMTRVLAVNDEHTMAFGLRSVIAYPARLDIWLVGLRRGHFIDGGPDWSDLSMDLRPGFRFGSDEAPILYPNNELSHDGPVVFATG